jgi:hypothetical protein
VEDLFQTLHEEPLARFRIDLEVDLIVDVAKDRRQSPEMIEHVRFERILFVGEIGILNLERTFSERGVFQNGLMMSVPFSK